MNPSEAKDELSENICPCGIINAPKEQKSKMFGALHFLNRCAASQLAACSYGKISQNLCCIPPAGGYCARNFLTYLNVHMQNDSDLKKGV